MAICHKGILLRLCRPSVTGQTGLLRRPAWQLRHSYSDNISGRLAGLDVHGPVEFHGVWSRCLAVWTGFGLGGSQVFRMSR